MSEPELCYVSRKTCGCLGIVVMAESPSAPHMVASAVKLGQPVETLAPEQMRQLTIRCAAHPLPAERQGPLL